MAKRTASRRSLAHKHASSSTPFRDLLTWTPSVPVLLPKSALNWQHVFLQTWTDHCFRLRSAPTFQFKITADGQLAEDRKRVPWTAHTIDLAHKEGCKYLESADIQEKSERLAAIFHSVRGAMAAENAAECVADVESAAVAICTAIEDDLQKILANHLDVAKAKQKKRGPGRKEKWPGLGALGLKEIVNNPSITHEEIASNYCRANGNATEFAKARKKNGCERPSPQDVKNALKWARSKQRTR